jgi:plastocyanin
MIQGTALDPQVLRVKRGTTVEWINNGDCDVVDAADNSFSSGVLKQGGAFRYTFNKRGTYRYRCHDGNAARAMSGSIVVTR